MMRKPRSGRSAHHVRSNEGLFAPTSPSSCRLDPWDTRLDSGSAIQPHHHIIVTASEEGQLHGIHPWSTRPDERPRAGSRACEAS